MQFVAKVETQKTTFFLASKGWVSLQPRHMLEAASLQVNSRMALSRDCALKGGTFSESSLVSSSCLVLGL